LDEGGLDTLKRSSEKRKVMVDFCSVLSDGKKFYWNSDAGNKISDFLGAIFEEE
jgi:hypothetical protein